MGKVEEELYQEVLKTSWGSFGNVKSTSSYNIIPTVKDWLCSLALWSDHQDHRKSFLNFRGFRQPKSYNWPDSFFLLCCPSCLAGLPFWILNLWKIGISSPLSYIFTHMLTLKYLLTNFSMSLVGRDPWKVLKGSKSSACQIHLQSRFTFQTTIFLETVSTF